RPGGGVGRPPYLGPGRPDGPVLGGRGLDRSPSRRALGARARLLADSGGVVSRSPDRASGPLTRPRAGPARAGLSRPPVKPPRRRLYPRRRLTRPAPPL